MSYALCFSPGPSAVSAAVRADLQAATQSNIPHISHRGKQFIAISQRAIDGLREFFNVPPDYHILYTSCAQEAWEISLKSCVTNTSFHFVQGAFSEKFAAVATALNKTALVDIVAWGKQNDYDNVTVPPEAELIAITHNETSTGVMCPLSIIQQVRSKYPEKFLAVDSTSIAGATPMDIAQADIWLFSVQKCFGLPAGLGLMIVHQRIVERAQQLINQKINAAGVFNLPAMVKEMAKYQTIATPNVMDIYLLAEQVQRWNHAGGLAKNITDTDQKYRYVTEQITQQNKFHFLVEQDMYRSRSVMCLTAEPNIITTAHEQAKAANIELGKGYGKLKDTTIRLGNFPAITMADFERVFEILGG